MTSATVHEVKPPAAVLAEDVICQSFIQSSSTLAYACLALRRGRHDLAAHVLHSLEQKPASRFKDMVFYLQCQIGIETGDFAAMKRRLVPRAHQHPNDMVALSLLASCVHLEWEDWRLRNPALAARTLAEERAETHIPDVQAEAGEAPAPVPAYHTLSVPTVPSAHAGYAGAASGIAPAAASAEPVLSPAAAALGRAPAPAAATPVPAAPVAATPAYRAPAAAPLPPNDAPYAAVSAGGEADFGIYQALASDPNTQALSLWNAAQRKLRVSCKKPALEAMVASLPQDLPTSLADAVRALDGGEIHKVCFSFQTLTVTSLHAGPENLGLVTGNMNQSLLTMVRAENIFLKGTQGQSAAARMAFP